MGNGERNEAGVAHHFINEGHHVGQPALVLNTGQLCARYNLVDLLSQTLLLLWVPETRMQKGKNQNKDVKGL